MRTFVHIISSSGTGGAQAVLCSILRRTDKQRYSTIVICAKDGEYVPEFEKWAGKCHCIDFEVSIPALCQNIRRILKAEQADIVFNHLWKACFVGALAARGIATSTFNNLHGELATGTDPAKLKIALFRQLYRWVSFLGAESIAVSHYNKRELVKYGVKATKVRVVYNGVESDRFVCPIRERVGRPFRVISTGRLHWQKGYDILLDAAKLLPNDIQISIAGTGDLNGHLQKRVKDERIENVSFLGFQSDVARLLTEADLFVLSSYWEGLSISIIEAMAMGLPVVATDVGGNRELIDDGRGGYIVPSGNAEALAESILNIYESGMSTLQMGSYNRLKFEKELTMKAMMNSVYGGYFQ